MSNLLYKPGAIHLIRHGEPQVSHVRDVNNKEIPLVYGPDTPLIGCGRDQAVALGQWYRDRQVPLAAVFCSPLIRTRETAESFLEGFGDQSITAPTVDPNLTDVNWGTEWIGKPLSQFWDWVKGGEFHSHQPYGKELINEIISRMYQAMINMMKEIPENGVAVAFGHADPIRLLLHYLPSPGYKRYDMNQIPNDIPVPYAGGYQVPLDLYGGLTTTVIQTGEIRPITLPEGYRPVETLRRTVER